MRKINFMMGIHNHQPVGNFDHVFEENYQKAYYPFLETLRRFPNVRLSLHFTGPLFQWLEKNHPEIFDLILEMVNRNQIEMIGGGFYEPILSVLPLQDAHGQMDLMAKYLKKKFHQEPKGFWLAERVWEPMIPSIVSKNKMQFTLLDDSHFTSAGLSRDKIHGYYITEDRGDILNIFPINYYLRYTIPFQAVEKTEEIFKELSQKQDVSGIVFADDGEKFGAWPGMYNWIYKEKWLEKFFLFLEKNRDWIEMPFFSEYIKDYKPEGRVYIPTASYKEMGEWTLFFESGEKFEKVLEDINHHPQKAKEFEPFVRGGFWRNFFAKYDEANNMYKKMLYVSKKVNSIKDSKIKDKALDYLWMGQCNCPYWHGVFGGLYLNGLRFAAYRNLLEAERLADQALHGSSAWQEIEQFDFDSDGNEEVLLSSSLLNLYFSPLHGGSLFEIDYKPKCFNVSDVLTRRPEIYHRKIKEAENKTTDIYQPASIHDGINLKEKGLLKHLHYDAYRRASLIDHFILENVSLDDFINLEYKELGDFCDKPYLFKQDKNNLIFKRKGSLHIKGASVPICVVKTIHLDKKESVIYYKYEIINESDKEMSCVFGTDLVFTLLAGNAPDRHYFIPGYEHTSKRMDSVVHLKNVNEVQAIDDCFKFKIVFSFKDTCDLWRFPIETISQSEAGIERNYQGSNLFPHWLLNLKPGEKWTTEIKQEFVGW